MDAMATGDIASAEKHLNAMRQLGLANTGPEVTLIVDLVGQAIVKRAENSLAALRQMRQNGATPTPPESDIK